MNSRRSVLFGSLAGLLVIVAAAWLLFPQPQFHYAVHTLSADADGLARARQAGFDTVVQLFSWRQIEPTRGQYHWQYPDEVVQGAHYYGLDLVVRLDQHPHWASPVPLVLNAPPDELADYARFVAAVAERYRGRVKGYIIWNEPNLAQEWGGRPPDPAGYVALLRVAYQAVKAADPDAVVISAGLAPTNSRDAAAMDDRLYLKAMYAAGAAPFFEVLGAHPYGFAHPPDDPHGAHEGLNLARLLDLRSIMVENEESDKPVWATELGWTVEVEDAKNAWQVVSPQEQADYLVGALGRARQEWPWLQLAAVWNLDGAETAQWAGYSLLDPDGEPRLAYHALEALDKGWKVPDPQELFAAAQAFWVEQWGQPRYHVLSEDSVSHLGDGHFGEPWMPLYGAGATNPTWQGTVYVPEPGTAEWRLTLRIMQSNTWENAVWINDHRLEPALYPEDFSGTWVSHTVKVPAGLLQPGPNRVALTIGQSIPLLREDGSLDDLQIKDVILWR